MHFYAIFSATRLYICNCFDANEFFARKKNDYNSEWKYVICEIKLKFMFHTLEKITTKKKNSSSFHFESISTLWIKLKKKLSEK